MKKLQVFVGGVYKLVNMWILARVTLEIENLQVFIGRHLETKKIVDFIKGHVKDDIFVYFHLGIHREVKRLDFWQGYMGMKGLWFIEEILYVLFNVFIKGHNGKDEFASLMSKGAT